MKKESSEVVSVTNQLKLLAPDGKRRLTDVLDADGIAMLAYLQAMTTSVTDGSRIKQLLRGALTDDISSREMFMKGIDYSYYYEQEDEV